MKIQYKQMEKLKRFELENKKLKQGRNNLLDELKQKNKMINKYTDKLR